MSLEPAPNDLSEYREGDIIVLVDEHDAPTTYATVTKIGRRFIYARERETGKGFKTLPSVVAWIDERG